MYLVNCGCVTELKCGANVITQSLAFICSHKIITFIFLLFSDLALWDGVNC